MEDKIKYLSITRKKLELSEKKRAIISLVQSTIFAYNVSNAIHKKSIKNYIIIVFAVIFLFVFIYEFYKSEKLNKVLKENSTDETKSQLENNKLMDVKKFKDPLHNLIFEIVSLVLMINYSISLVLFVYFKQHHYFLDNYFWLSVVLSLLVNFLALERIYKELKILNNIIIS